MAKNDVVNYGFGQMGSVHCKTDNSVYPPKGMAIVAIQFLADNIPTRLRQLDEKDRGNFECFEIGAAAHADGETTASIPNATGGVVTHAAGTDITLNANNTAIKVGMMVIEQGGIGDATTNLLVPDGATGFDGCFVTKIVAANKIQLSHPIKSANGGGTTLTFLDHLGSGAGGEDAASIKYPKGMIIYGRWSEVRPEADADGGIICYYGI